jgi:hypothetical protein
VASAATQYVSPGSPSPTPPCTDWVTAAQNIQGYRGGGDGGRPRLTEDGLIRIPISGLDPYSSAPQERRDWTSSISFINRRPYSTNVLNWASADEVTVASWNTTARCGSIEIPPE